MRQREIASRRREKIADEIPMPRVPSITGARILQWLVLKSGGGKPHAATVLEQQLAVGRHQVRHEAASPDVPVHPEPAVHGEDHSLSAKHELAIRAVVCFEASVTRGPSHSRSPIADQLQVMRPSSVEGARGEAVPKYTVHFSAPNERCVADADHPPAVASGTTIVTPVEVM